VSVAPSSLGVRRLGGQNSEIQIHTEFTTRSESVSSFSQSNRQYPCGFGASYLQRVAR